MPYSPFCFIHIFSIKRCFSFSRSDFTLFLCAKTTLISQAMTQSLLDRENKKVLPKNEKATNNNNTVFTSTERWNYLRAVKMARNKITLQFESKKKVEKKYWKTNEVLSSSSHCVDIFMARSAEHFTKWSLQLYEHIENVCIKL